MLSKLSLLALVSPLVSALTLNVPSGVTSGGHVTITWSTGSNDPSTFTLELNKEEFNKALAIANNVNTSAGTLDVTLPPVPNGDGYTLQAVNITDINDVFATSGSFSIAAAPSSSKGASATGAGSVSSNGTGSAAATGTAPASSNPAGSAAATGTGSASSPNASATSPSGSSSSSAASSGTSSSAGTNPSTSASHASRIGGSPAAFVAVIVSVAAGAALIAL